MNYSIAGMSEVGVTQQGDSLTRVIVWVVNCHSYRQELGFHCPNLVGERTVRLVASSCALDMRHHSHRANNVHNSYIVEFMGGSRSGQRATCGRCDCLEIHRINQSLLCSCSATPDDVPCCSDSVFRFWVKGLAQPGYDSSILAQVGKLEG